MKRFAALALVLFGCRTLVGIDDLSPDPGRPDGGNGQQNQGDGAAPTLSQQQQQQIDGCLNDAGAGGCRQCCKMAFHQLVNTIARSGTGCLCQQNTCLAKCSVAPSDGGTIPVCDPGALDPSQNQGVDQDASNACLKCEDDTLSTTPPANDDCRNLCGNDSDCFAGLSCLQQCH